MSLKAVFNTWSGAFFNPGGGEVQLLQTKDYLEKAGVQVDFYDQWNPERNPDIFHQFSIQQGGEFPIREYKALGKKVALSTILWAELPKDSEFYRHIRELFLLSDILLTNSDAESRKLARAYEVDLGKFHKTRNAIPAPYLNTKTSRNFRETYNIQGEFVLSVANVDRRKNTHALNQSCKKLGKKLVLIGHIRDIPYFDEFKSSNPDLLYLGPISDVEMLKSAYQQCDLYALPSLCETPGIAALEAASQGAKIVITNEGPTEEYFGSHVTYVDPHDHDGITRGIASELSRSRNKSVIIAHVTSEYTWDKTAQDVLAGYRKVLA